MYKVTKFLGIDVSKDVFDVSVSNGKHFQFFNNVEGFAQLHELLDGQSHCVIKRFVQMRLRLAKTG